MLPQATDLSSWPGVRRAMKAPVDVAVRFAAADGVCTTLEGPVSYRTGDPILTGTRGENWTMPLATFNRAYAAVPEQAGTYRKRPLVVQAVCLRDAVDVAVNGGAGALHGAPGDWLVQYGPGDFGVVAPDIFAATYQLQTP